VRLGLAVVADIGCNAVLRVADSAIGPATLRMGMGIKAQARWRLCKRKAALMSAAEFRRKHPRKRGATGRLRPV